MKTKLLSILSLAGFFLLIYLCPISAQINNWYDVVNHAVLDHGEAGEWDDRQVWTPAVIKDGDTLRMYYTGGDEIVWESPNTSIGYAWSLNGVDWTRYHSNPVIEPKHGWQIFGCAVLKDEDNYKMWFGESDMPGTASIRIGYAVSDDGIHWTKKKYSVLPLGPESDWDESVICPQTVIKEGDTYIMWYWGGKQVFPFKESMPQTGMATSTNGTGWIKYDDPTTTEAPFASSDPVLKHGSVGDWDAHRAINPMIVKKKYGYEMWYIGASWDDPYHDVGYAYSSDGIHWVKHPKPVFNSSILGNTIYGGTVLAFDNNYHLWYAGFHPLGDQAAPAIGYATTPHPIGIESHDAEATLQLYPNPTSGSTKIYYELKNASHVQIAIYNHLGNQVEIIEQKQSQGKQQILWNAEGLPAGVYFCMLKTEEGIGVKKFIKAE